MTKEEFLQRYKSEHLCYRPGYRLCLNQGIKTFVMDHHDECLAFGVTQTTTNGKWYVFSALPGDERSQPSAWANKEFEPDEEEKAYDYLYNLIKPKQKPVDDRTPEQIASDDFYRLYPEARPAD